MVRDFRAQKMNGCNPTRWLVFLGLALVLPLFWTPFAQGKGFCAMTTDAAAKSCADQLQADYWLNVGKCNNLADDEAREECLQDAMDERKDARGDCKDQTLARQEICAELGEDAYDPVIDPANFVADIDNPYLPMVPGTSMIYEGDGETVTVTVTDQTVEILGVTCTVVRDTVTEDGEVVEDTFDWFAQDDDGNVWYFGELSKEYENGELISLEGSWKAGVDGARPGIVMLADPMLFDTYRQEFLLGEAEDMASVADEGQNVSVEAGDYSNVLVTEEWTPIEPDVLEYKFYAPGVGLVLEENPETGGRVELVEVVMP